MGRGLARASPLPRMLGLILAILPVTKITGHSAGVAPPAQPVVLSILPRSAVLENALAARRRRLQPMNGGLGGNTEPLGYFYTRLRVGTPGQDFTVIVDTGSSLLAVPCEGCKTCGRHMSAPFDPTRSSSFRKSDCTSHACAACDHGECTYHERFVEGSSIAGKLSLERLALLPGSPASKAASGAEPSVVVEALFGCQTSESGYFKSQDADGILGLGRGAVPTLLDVLSTQGPVTSLRSADGGGEGVVHGAPLPDTMSFCIGRSGGEVVLGVEPPKLEMPPYVVPRESGGGDGEHPQGLANPYAALTALRPHKKNYIVSIRSLVVRLARVCFESLPVTQTTHARAAAYARLLLRPRSATCCVGLCAAVSRQVGDTELGIEQSIYNSGQGVLLDSGTSLMYFPRAAHRRLLSVFHKEMRELGILLPKAEEIEGASCWTIETVGGSSAAASSGSGYAQFPELHVQFASKGNGVAADQHGSASRASRLRLHPTQYIFVHPSEEQPTHYCLGVLDNGPSGVVLGAIFMRHTRMTIDRRASGDAGEGSGMVFFEPDDCGDRLE